MAYFYVDVAWRGILAHVMVSWIHLVTFVGVEKTLRIKRKVVM